MSRFYFTFLVYLLTVIPILLDFLGLYCLYKNKLRKENQKLFLYHITIVELLLNVIGIVLITLDLLPNVHRTVRNVIVSLHGGASLVFYLIMLLITLDRLACVLLHIKYKILITNKLIRAIIYCSWVLGFLSVIPLSFTASELTKDIVYTYGFVVSDSIVVLAFSVCYVAITCMLRVRRERLSSSSSKTRTHGSVFRKQYLIPFLIITSFVLFYGIPDAVMTFSDKTEEQLQIVTVFWSLGFVADPLIYIFFNRAYRKTAICFFRCTSPNGRVQDVGFNSSPSSVTRRDLAKPINKVEFHPQRTRVFNLDLQPQQCELVSIKTVQ